MDLFHRHRNKYYALIRQWCSDGLLEPEKGEERAKASRSARDSLVHYDYILTLELHKDQYCFSSLTHSSPELPLLFTALEKKYLKTLLDNQSFCHFIGGELTEILSNYLADTEKFPLEEFFQDMSACSVDFSMSHPENMLLLYQGIVEKRCVAFDYQGTDGVFYENQTLYPFRLLYDKELRLWQLLCFTQTEKQEVLCNLERMGQVTLTEEWLSDCLQELLEKNREEKILRLRLRKDYNSVERSFLLFHDYQSTPDYHSETEEYFLSISYNPDWDEEDLCAKVLSLGSAVEVLEPEEFREKIITQLKIMLEG